MGSFLLLLPLLLLVHGLPNSFGDDPAEDEAELVLLQALWRHGDRSPTRTFKTDIYQEDDWPQGWGQLTKEGMAQHVKLGKKLRERYMDQLGFISKQYKSHEIYVRSTDFNRTLISAISNMIGFYGPGMDEDYPKELGSDWPGWYVPIAVHTVSGKEDFIAPGDPHCPRQEELRRLLVQAPEYQRVVGEYKWLLELLEEKAGENFVEDPFRVWIVGDAFYIEGIHKKKLVDWAEGNETLREEIRKFDEYTQKWMNGLGLSPLEDVEFDKELPRIRGGPILWNMIGNMQEKLHCGQKMNAVREVDREIPGRKSPMGAPLCKWLNRMRYFVYSAHDSTIAALFTALGFQKTNYDAEGFPPYTACVTTELWQKKRGDGRPFVKLLYWRPDPKGQVQMVDITKAVEGCPQGEGELCHLDQFIERSKPYRMEPSPMEYCQMPLKPTTPSSGGSTAATTAATPAHQNSASSLVSMWLLTIGSSIALLWML